MQRQSFALLPVPLALLMAVAACSAETTSDDAPDEPISQSISQSTAVRDVSVSEAKALLASESAPTVIDVRTPEEFEAGHIEGAVNVDFRSGDFAEELAKLDKGQTFLLHCKSGGRSTQALAEMQAQGFEDIAHMTGGYDAWSAEDAGE